MALSLMFATQTRTQEREVSDMTAVAYTVGNQSTTSYAQALALQEQTGEKLVRHYIPIPETPALDDRAKMLRDKRVQARKEKMGWA